MEVVAANYPILASYSLDWVVAKSKESTDRKLVVDVGGSKGHALRSIGTATPGLDMSRCVLEDLPEVVAAARELADPSLKDVEMVGVDFHSEQPVKGE
jgi:hypothetical protein